MRKVVVLGREPSQLMTGTIMIIDLIQPLQSKETWAKVLLLKTFVCLQGYNWKDTLKMYIHKTWNNTILVKQHHHGYSIRKMVVNVLVEIHFVSISAGRTCLSPYRACPCCVVGYGYIGDSVILVFSSCVLAPYIEFLHMIVCMTSSVV